MHSRLSIVSVGLVAVGTRKIVISLGGDYNYAHTCSMPFMHVSHIGGWGLDLSKVSSHGCHAGAATYITGSRKYARLTMLKILSL